MSTPRTGADRKRAEMFADELDFAYFAARLGWSKEDYEDTTPAERLFVRKELESVTVEQSDLMKNAVQVAVSNAMSKRKSRLWRKRRKKADPVISDREMRAMKDRFEKQTPWTPWSR